MDSNTFNLWLDGAPISTLQGEGKFNLWLLGAPVLDVSAITPSCPPQYIVCIMPVASLYSVNITDAVPSNGIDVVIQPTVECNNV